MSCSAAKKKTIVFLKSNACFRGGLEKYTLQLVNACAEAGFHVYLLTTDGQDLDVAESVSIVSFGKKKRLSLFHLLWFDMCCFLWLRKHPVDYVFGMDRNFVRQHFYRAGNGVHAAYLERRKQQASWWKKISFTINPLHRLLLAMEKKTFESNDLRALITNSFLVSQEISQYYPRVDSAKVHVVHNGVAWEALQKNFDATFQDKERFLQKLGVDPHLYQFLFIGNEYERKGLPQLLRALASLERRDWNLFVVGKERNEDRFIQLRNALGLQERVFFFGQRRDVYEFYKASDALVVASIYDPFANVTIEALAMGLYVISSSQNGGSEVITSDSGFVFTTERELKAGLNKALLHPKTDISSRLIRNAYKDFDFSHQIKKILTRLR